MAVVNDNVVFTRTARCVKILGKGVVKVVHRCDAAKENQQLGQSSLTILIILYHVQWRFPSLNNILYIVFTTEDWLFN